MYIVVALFRHFCFSALLLAGSRGSSRSNRTGRREGQYRKYQVVNCVNNFIVVTKKVWIRDWLAGLISAPRLLLPPSNMQNVLRYWHSCCDVSVEIAKTGIHTDSTVLMVNRREKKGFSTLLRKGARSRYKLAHCSSSCTLIGIKLPLNFVRNDKYKERHCKNWRLQGVCFELSETRRPRLPTARWCHFFLCSNCTCVSRDLAL